jgi:hypothetical protein
LAAEYQTSQRTIGWILRDELHMNAYKSRRNKLFAAGGTARRLQRAQSMKWRFAQFDLNSIIFSDEKFLQ